MRTLFGLLALISSIPALACTPIVGAPYYSNRQLVADADGIVMARVIGFEPAVYQPRSERRFAIFHFEALEVIKGNSAPRFDLSGFSASADNVASGDFDGHRLPEFWAERSSNSISPGDCEFYGRYAVGETYLIFLAKHTHSRGYENIRSAEDIWLNVVKLLVGAEEKTK